MPVEIIPTSTIPEKIELVSLSPFRVSSSIGAHFLNYKIDLQLVIILSKPWSPSKRSLFFFLEMPDTTAITPTRLKPSLHLHPGVPFGERLKKHGISQTLKNIKVMAEER